MKIKKKIITYKELPELRAQSKKSGKTIVLTMGSFDIVHLGHAAHFDYCKSKGDILVVGVGSDKNISRLKGPERPINNQNARAKLLTYFNNVDYVVISEEEGPFDIKVLVPLLQPDVFVLPENDGQLKQRKTFLKASIIKVIVCKRIPPAELPQGISTTEIIKRLGEL